MSPSVSLLVPTFNRADLLVPCLDSALAQTMPDLEVVVVDGASTDATWDVCLRYAAADARVRVFRDPVNSGPVRGWWRCVEEARGEYATFLWSDDMIRPDFLLRTVPVMSRADVAFVFTAAEIGSAPGAGTIHYAHRSGLMASDKFIEGTLTGAGGYPVSPACALFRLTDLQRSFTMELPTHPVIDLTATGAGTDVLLYLLTARRYPLVACLSEPLAFFRAHPGSMTVDGRGGQVALGYVLTRSWFARENGYRDQSRAILTRQWLGEMRASGRLVSPAVAAKQYRHIVGARELVTTAAILLARKATRGVVRGRSKNALAAGNDVSLD
jgi:glycosyltransferase involved in cell wall biosynthesis